MSDFIRTIDSDDEDLGAPSAVASTSAAPAQGSKKRQHDGGQNQPASKKAAKNDRKDREKAAKNAKGKGRQVDDDAEGLAMNFQFDALGGGEYLSNGHRLGDAWDINDMSRLFKKRNAPPRLTVDDIIARRRMQAEDAADAEANGQDLEEEVDASDDSEADFDSDSDEVSEGFIEELEDDEEGDSDEQLSDDEELGDGDSDAESPDLADEAREEELSDSQSLADEDDEDEDDEDDDEDEEADGLSAFAKLANAGASLDEDDEDEALNFSKAADATTVDKSYFASAPSTSGPRMSTNEANERSSLPPFSAMPGARLSRAILLGLSNMGLTVPTPVQAQTIPVALMGKDIVGSSITGSGKTVAFWVGVLERLLYRDKKDARTRVLVITPTRELAVQVFNVGVALARYTDIRFCLCVGGLSLKAQEAELRTRPDVLVVTPGRLIDHIRNTPSFSLVDSIEILIMDEADRVLEEGFKDELLEIIKNLPKKKQSMLFSATITEDVKTLSRLSLVKPVRINIDVGLSTSARLLQEFVKLRLPNASSKTHPATLELARQATLLALCQSLATDATHTPGKTIIFFRNKKMVHRVKILFSLFDLRAEELHGDLTQEMRMKALSSFKEGKCDWLLATDLASRGLDIQGISTVINYSMPGSFEIYLHRVGRTARAGKTGRAITIVTEGDRKMVRQAIKASQAPVKKKAKTAETDADESADTYEMRSLPSELVKAVTSKIQELGPEIQAILLEEKEEKEFRQTEVDLYKGENMLKYRDEIMARPKRTWFQSEKDKGAARKEGTKAWNDKMDAKGSDVGKSAIEARKEQSRRDDKKYLNHKQKRRAEALDEIKGSGSRDSSSGKTSLPKFDVSVRNAKKAQRPGPDQQKLGKKSKSKSKSKPKRSAAPAGATDKAKSSKSPAGSGKARSSTNQKPKQFSGKRK